MRQLVDQSRREIIELLHAIAAAADPDHIRQKSFSDAVASYGERMSAAMLAAVLVNNHVSSSAATRVCVLSPTTIMAAPRLYLMRLSAALRRNCNRCSILHAYRCSGDLLAPP